MFRSNWQPPPPHLGRAASRLCHATQIVPLFSTGNQHPTRSNSRNSFPFSLLLHDSLDTPGDGSVLASHLTLALPTLTLAGKEPEGSLNPISSKITTYKEYARNPFRIRTCKTQDLKPFRINTCRKPRGRVVPVSDFSLPSSLSTRHGLLGFTRTPSWTTMPGEFCWRNHAR